MDQVKIGELIKSLRKEKGFTQLELAGKLGVSDKAVSKWERGFGCPDISSMPMLSQIFGVNLEALLSGELAANETDGGNMKKTKFYVCPDCGNILTSATDADLACCGKKLAPLEPQAPEGDEQLTFEHVEDEYYVTTEHEMTREHHIMFLAILTGDSMLMKRFYPEWNLQTRIPYVKFGTLFYYCSQHGLYKQIIKA